MATAKHPKRFIIEYKGFSGKWIRTGNYGIKSPFYNREDEEAALNAPDVKSIGFQYRIRTK